MKHYPLKNVAQHSGWFTDLFILGTNHAYNSTTKTWGSDFTTAGLTQTYNLIELTTAAGVVKYVVGYPFGMIVVRTPFATGADNPKADLGTSTTAAASIIAGTANDLEVRGTVVVPLASILPSVGSAGTQLTATITSAVANVSALVGAAEIYIYAALLPVTEWSTYRQA